MADTAMDVYKEQAPTNWRPRVILVSAVVGAAVGVAAAMLLISRSENDEPPRIGVGEGVKLGVLVFGLLRSVASLND